MPYILQTNPYNSYNINIPSSNIIENNVFNILVPETNEFTELRYYTYSVPNSSVGNRAVNTDFLIDNYTTWKWGGTYKTVEYNAISNTGGRLSFYIEENDEGGIKTIINSANSATMDRSELRGYTIYYVNTYLQYAGRTMKVKTYLTAHLPTNYGLDNNENRLDVLDASFANSQDVSGNIDRTYVVSNKINNKDTSWWKNLFSKGKNVLVIILKESIHGRTRNKMYEYIVDVNKEDVSGIQIDVEGNINDIDNIRVNYNILYENKNVVIEEEVDVETGEVVICKGSCKCTARTIRNCKVSKSLNLVTPNTLSRAEKLHRQRVNNKKGKTLLQQWVLDKNGRRSHLISSDNICPEPQPVNEVVSSSTEESQTSTTATTTSTTSTTTTTSTSSSISTSSNY